MNEVLKNDFNSRQELMSPSSRNSMDNISEVRNEGDILVPNMHVYPNSGSKNH